MVIRTTAPKTLLLFKPLDRIRAHVPLPVPTLPNKLEADYTGTQPGDGPRRAGCTCGPPAPSSQSWGRGAALDSPPSPPGAGRRRQGGVSGEVKGLTFWAPGQQGQTPNTRLREESVQPYAAVLAPPTGRREARAGSARARGSRREAAGLSSRRARGPGASHSNCPKRNNAPGPRGQRWAPGPATPALRYPLRSPRVRSRSLRPGRGAKPLRRTPPAPARLPPAQRSALARERCAPTLGGSLAAEPRLMLRQEVAASPAAGGGCTRTRRGGEGARRPGPCSRGPARGGHLEARRRSRGTTGGGSGGDQSSST